MSTDPAAAIARARAADPGNAFVEQIAAFFEARGYLSDKQLASLARVTPTRSRVAQYHAINWGSEYYSRDDYGNGQSGIRGGRGLGQGGACFVVRRGESCRYKPLTDAHARARLQDLRLDLRAMDRDRARVEARIKALAGLVG